MYKTAGYFFNDRASVMHTDQGLQQHLPHSFTVTHQISKWMGKIESVMYMDAAKSNIDAQIFYMQVLTAICKTP
jgi:hypothetical protein